MLKALYDADHGKGGKPHGRPAHLDLAQPKEITPIHQLALVGQLHKHLGKPLEHKPQSWTDIAPVIVEAGQGRQRHTGQHDRSIPRFVRQQHPDQKSAPYGDASYHGDRVAMVFAG